jgi:hypothetical protein
MRLLVFMCVFAFLSQGFSAEERKDGEISHKSITQIPQGYNPSPETVAELSQVREKMKEGNMLAASVVAAIPVSLMGLDPTAVGPAIEAANSILSAEVDAVSGAVAVMPALTRSVIKKEIEEIALKHEKANDKDAEFWRQMQRSHAQSEQKIPPKMTFRGTYTGEEEVLTGRMNVVLHLIGSEGDVKGSTTFCLVKLHRGNTFNIFGGICGNQLSLKKQNSQYDDSYTGIFIEDFSGIRNFVFSLGGRVIWTLSLLRRV